MTRGIWRGRYSASSMSLSYYTQGAAVDVVGHDPSL